MAQDEKLLSVIEYFQKNRSELLEKRKVIDFDIEKKQIYLESLLNTKDDLDVFNPRLGDFEKKRLEQDHLEHELYDLVSQMESIDNEISSIDSYITILNQSINQDVQFSDFQNSDMSGLDEGLEVIHLQEEDRKRIARDLHDTSLQNLTYLNHKLELCSLFIDQDPVRAKMEIDLVRQNMKKIADEIRRTIYNLRPMSFDDLGFKQTILHMIDVLNYEKKLFVNVDIVDNVSCENTVLINIYRIIQEAFQNIIKHAKASTVSISMKQEMDTYVIHMSDDGIGFSLEELQQMDENHFGFHLMKERVGLIGGTINIDSKKGEGTFIDITFSI